MFGVCQIPTYPITPGPVQHQFSDAFIKNVQERLTLSTQECNPEGSQITASIHDHNCSKDTSPIMEDFFEVEMTPLTKLFSQNLTPRQEFAQKFATKFDRILEKVPYI